MNFRCPHCIARESSRRSCCIEPCQAPVTCYESPPARASALLRTSLNRCTVYPLIASKLFRFVPISVVFASPRPRYTCSKRRPPSASLPDPWIAALHNKLPLQPQRRRFSGRTPHRRRHGFCKLERPSEQSHSIRPEGRRAQGSKWCVTSACSWPGLSN